MDIKGQFKLACLSYNPSSINYRDNPFERLAMIRLLNTICDETSQLQYTSIHRLKDDVHERILDRAIMDVKEWQLVQQVIKRKQDKKRDKSVPDKRNAHLTQNQLAH